MLKTNRIAAIFFCGAVVLTLGGVYFWGNAPADPQEKNHLAQSTATGFPADTKISYRTSPDKKSAGLTIAGSGTQSARSLDLAVDPKSGRLAVSGAGFDPFENINVTDGKNDFNLAADWAGIMRQSVAVGSPEKSSGPAEIKIAMSGAAGGLLADLENDPRVVRVLMAPGGGLYFPSQLNAYINLPWCNSFYTGGTFTPSTCDPQTMPQSNIDSLQGRTRHMEVVAFNVMDNYVRALMMMTEQLSAVMMNHVYILGSMFDAKQQLERYRTVRTLTAQAHKDYHPSEMMCNIGSFIKSVPVAEQKAAYDKMAMNAALMEVYGNTENRSSAEGYAIDIEARIVQFREVYCDPMDNNNGLQFMCEHDQDQNLNDSFTGSSAPRGIGTPQGSADRMNKDIDIARTLDFPMTLDMDFSNTSKTSEEEDVLALARNLYWPQALESAPFIDAPREYNIYMDARRVFAIQNVAHNSFIQIAAMKSRAPDGIKELSGWNFMKAYMRELGLNNTEIDKFMGEHPSYYAQMEVMTKKMFQHPDFFTNLYDKPVNVERIGISLDAIGVMQQRDMLKSLHRQEMIDSMMVETELAPLINRINGNAMTEVKNLK